MAENKGLVLGLNLDQTQTRIDSEIPKLIKKINADIKNNESCQLIIGLNSTKTKNTIINQIKEMMPAINQALREAKTAPGIVLGLDKKQTEDNIRSGVFSVIQNVNDREGSPTLTLDVDAEGISTRITNAINTGVGNAQRQVDVGVTTTQNNRRTNGNGGNGGNSGRNGNGGNGGRSGNNRGNTNSTYINPPENARTLRDDPQQVRMLAQLQARTASFDNRLVPSFRNSTNTMMSEFNEFKRALASPEAINEVQALSTQFSSLSAQITNAGGLTKSFGDQLKTSLSSSVFAGMAKMMVTTAVLGNFATMYENVKKIDKQFTELRKVSSATMEELNSYMERASAKAGELGVNISELVSATADFARLGYQLKDAESLGETATKFYQVGDDFEDISQSTQVIVSALAAQFNNLKGLSAAEGAQTLVDEMNEVSNNYSISAGGLAEAMTRSAASLAQAGATSSQAWGIITGSNAVVQDPDSVGTTLKTKFFKNCLCA